MRSRYLRHDETVQDQPRGLSSLASSITNTPSSSPDVSLCISENDVDIGDPAEGERSPLLGYQRGEEEDDDLGPLCLTPGLTQSPTLLAGSPPDTPLLGQSPILEGSARSMTILADSASRAPLLLDLLPASNLPVGGEPPCQVHYYSLAPQADDEIVLTPNHDQEEDEDDDDANEEEGRIYEASPLQARRTNGRVVTIGVTGKRWGIRRTPGSSLPSLTEPDSPPTTSIDLEWEPEAGLVRMSQESLGEEEASHTGESTSWIPRSSCSTPNSLEWDFRASTLSLRGATENESWQHADMETEQLLHEIEQLAARALSDTGHGLQPAPR